MAHQTDTATVLAARAGDPEAIDRLVAEHLPLVYSIVGRALSGHADVDDVVQDTMLRVVRNLGDLRDPEAFRSWLVAIAVRQTRDRHQARRATSDAPLPEDLQDPSPDFADLTIARLELSGQRRETAEATRWMDEDHREVLSLWWLETSGELTREELADALDLSREHAAVRVQRMKAQLGTARSVVRVLAATPPCDELTLVTAEWDGEPAPVWRKRIARHVRECRRCTAISADLLPVETLLGGLGLVPVPAILAALGQDAGAHALGQAAAGAEQGASLMLGGVAVSKQTLAAVLVAVTLVVGGAVTVAVRQPDDAPVAAAVASRPTPAAAQPVTRTPEPTPTSTPTPEAPPP
uniref:RNA polymerase sigma factor n=1 Tax=Actinotalea sp. C106 TaxID=2908644 RepID=UPI00202786F5